MHSNILYSADGHHHHRNILKYTNRAFSSVEEMNEALVERWNERVRPQDTVYYLGDFAFCRPEEAAKILDSLNGKKHLIWGNHDSKAIRELPQWTSSQSYLEINDSGKFIVLLHYAMKVWNKSHHGALHFHGHSHGSLPGNSQSLDVGVDCWDCYPVTLDEILARMATLPSYRSVDHHV